MHNYIYQPPYLVLCYESLAYYYHNIEGLMTIVFSENNMVKMMIPIVIRMSDDIEANNLADIHQSSSRHRKHLVQSPSPIQIDGNQHVADTYSNAFLYRSVHNPVAA